ncbi:PaaX-like protein C-terminal domain protein [Streptomyces graminofaciens]|uniref:PaaX-like protein C-terminal domain protein n=1 Tax=Streptomyces graminofaciens TaxID=68212 RepID=A0ABM7FBW8_9ACTN|nr:PaaX family transcriptional regulator C-terminal domain-containing protein [Streptomyces graminofaciens]BBC33799.1 PaaX-like protein C-terminal domain protein [Streptomyces graminofaciens]
MEDEILEASEALDAGAVSAPQLRPQSLVLAFFGNHVLERGEGGLGVYSGSIIDVLGRVGTGEQAVRSTLTRMVNRGLLRRQREGRKMFFGLTAPARSVLRDGGQRIWRDGAVNEDWDGTWTLLGFSLPESWQRQRHDLRSRLGWSGFGALYSGLWIAPGRVDVRDIVSELGLDAHVKVFHARAEEFTDVGLMIRESWDLEALAARYVAFDKRWTTETTPDADPIATRLRLVTEWLRIIRNDPRLPVQHLPEGWPALQAQETFRRIAEQTEGPAVRMADELLETTRLRSA